MPRKKNPKNNYFNQEVEDAVCAYLHTTDTLEREKQFRLIYPALCKIAEVWYHKTKFCYSDDDMQDVMANCVAWLVEKMPMFKCGQGTKAFSYYSVTARFYYIALANKNYRYFKKNIPLSSMTENWDVANSDTADYIHSENIRMLSDFMKYCNHNLERMFTTKFQFYGKMVLDAMENFEEIEDLRRRKVLGYIFKKNGISENKKTNITKAINTLTTQFNLWKDRWESGDDSLEFIKKNYLTSEEQKIIKENIKIGKKNNGTIAYAKKFGVNVSVVNNYLKLT